ncbi:MAG: CcmD family protein [Cyclobacteriaceae bacterium]|nr:CcmD family protein [Cyclobacteriaceae bacterium]
MKRIANLLAGAFLLLTTNLYSQEVEMADTMRSEGKIYVILAIVLIVLIGLILYLFLMDRKLKKMEDQLK